MKLLWKVTWAIITGVVLVLCVLGWKHIVYFVDRKWEDLIVNTVGTLLGFVLAYLLYLIQAAATAAADKRKAIEAAYKERVATVERYAGRMHWYNDTLKEIIDFVKVQADQLALLVDRMMREPYAPQQLAFVTSFSLDRLARLPDVETTFHAYKAIFSDDPNWRDNYRRLLRITDNLADAIAHKKETFRRYVDAIYTRQLRLKELIERSANELSGLQMSMDPGGSNAQLSGSDFREFVNDTLLHYNLSLIARQASLTEILNEYVEPLKRPLLAHRQVPGVHQLLMTLKDASVLLNDIEFQSQSFISAFSPAALREPADALELMYVSLVSGVERYEASIKESVSGKD